MVKDLIRPVKKQEYAKLIGLLLGLILVTATFFRFNGLGTTPLSVDEYYFTKSVSFITEKWIPEYAAGGGIYNRGPLQQYLSAALMVAGAPVEWVARFWPALCGVLTVLGTYFLAQVVANRRMALVTAGLVAFSLWEVEMSRFGRMYAPFQAVFIWYLYFLSRGILENNWLHLRTAFFLSCVSILIHTGAIFLLVFNLFPWLILKQNKDWRLLLWPVVPFLGYFSYHRLTNIQGAPKLPLDLISSPIAPGSFAPVMPPLLLPYVASNLVAALVYLALCLAALRVIWPLVLPITRLELWSLAAAVAIAGAALNQLSLSMLAMSVAYLMYRSPNRITTEKANWRAIALLTSGYFLFWIGFGLLDASWYGQVINLDLKDHPQHWLQLTGVLFNYPEVVTRFLKPMIMPMPLNTLLLLLGAAGVLIQGWRNPHRINEGVRLLMMVFVASILLVSLISTDQKISRYSYFIYPLLLLFVVLCLYEISSFLSQKKLRISAFVLGTAVFMLVSEDFGWYHLAHLNQPEIAYRTKYSLDVQNHYYPKRDFRTPGEFINEHIRPGDLIVSEVSPIDLYLDQPIDYIYLPMEQKRFWTRATLHGTKDRWTGSDLIYRQSDLMKLLEFNDKPIWLAVFSTDWFNEPVDIFGKKPKFIRRYTNLDNTVEVYFIPPSPPSALEPFDGAPVW